MGVWLTRASIVASLSSLAVFGASVWADARALGLWIGVAVALAVAGAVMSWYAMDLVWSGRDSFHDVAVGAFKLACMCLILMVLLLVFASLYFTRDACCG